MRVFIFLLLLSLFIVLPARAQTPSPATTPRPVSDNEVNRVSKTIFCPVCQNVPLEVCETQACSRWREQVRDLLSQGYTDAQVRQYFIEHFGAQTVGVAADPTGQLLTVVIPLALIVLVGGIVGLGFIMRRGRSATAVTEPAPPITPTDDYRARLEEEIRKRE